MAPQMVAEMAPQMEAPSQMVLHSRVTDGSSDGSRDGSSDASTDGFLYGRVPTGGYQLHTQVVKLYGLGDLETWSLKIVLMSQRSKGRFKERVPTLKC